MCLCFSCYRVDSFRRQRPFSPSWQFLWHRFLALGRREEWAGRGRLKQIENAPTIAPGISSLERPYSSCGHVAEQISSFTARPPLSGCPCSCLRGSLRGFSRTFPALLGGQSLSACKTATPPHFRHDLRNMIVTAHDVNSTP